MKKKLNWDERALCLCLTLGMSGNLTGQNDIYAYDVTATVYANVDGHAGKVGEQTFSWDWDEELLSICKNDNRVCLWNTWLHMGTASEGDVFYKIENGAFTINESISVSYASETPEYEGITEADYNALDKKYTSRKELLSYNHNNGISVLNRGILSVPGVNVNGVAVQLSADPYHSALENQFMVPLRDVLEAMGVAVYANSDASVILASTKGDTLVITYKDFSDSSFEGINNTYYGRDKTYKYCMNGGGFQKITIEFTNGRAFVPLQTIVSLFGGNAEWNGKSGAMCVTYNIPDSSRMSQEELKKLANFDLNQAQKIAVSKGYGGPWDSAPIIVSEATVWNFDGVSGLAFKNGKAIWTLYAVEKVEYFRDETGRPIGESITMYRIDVANDGTVTPYPNEKAYISAGAA